ncbi:hypothetical protein AB6T85_21770 [Erwinia sp. ACCC 02193]|jgi:hypothetical protein|uniref:Uncharacterized protein n=1 Tax=Erwinia aeris TaxID=3239803 RepID=A0ABV4EE50_9GAMM
MRYTVYVQYSNGAKGNSYTEGTKAKIFQWFTQILSNDDLRQTAQAVIIEQPRGEVYRYDLASGAPVPTYADIPWPRPGRSTLIEGGRSVSAFITEDEQEYVRKAGGGNFSRGIRNLVNELKVLRQVQA